MKVIRLTNNPSTLFLIDGIGAIVSAIMLGIVLPLIDDLIGMPVQMLYYFTFVALSFAIYSFVCYAMKSNRWPILLRLIAIANLTYCAASIGIVICYYPLLTKLGLAYFILEKIIVFSLAMVDLKMSIR